MKTARKKILKAAGLLLGLQAFEELTGLLNQMLVAASFGTSATMDGYLVATTIVGLIVLWVRLPVRETVIPLFRYDLEQRGERVAWANASVLFNDVVLVLVVVVVMGQVLAPYLVAVLAPGFDEATSSLATSLFRITSASVILVAMGSILTQIYFSYERFFRPGSVGIINDLVVMGVLIAVGGTYGIYALAVAIVLGAACRVAFLLPIVWEKRKFYSTNVNLRNAQVTEMGKLSLPLLISTGGNELARITDRVFASLLPMGSLSALAFAHRPTSVLFEFLVQPLQQATFPHFTKLSATEDFRTLSRQLFQYLRVVFFFSLPVAVGIMLLAEPLIRVLYQRGAFDETAVYLTSQAVFFYAIGFPAHAITRILRRTYFGLKDTWTPTKIALACIGFKIVLSWILIGALAHAGIALAESVSQAVNALCLFWFLPKQIKGQEGWTTLTSFAQTLICCLVMGAVVYVARDSVYGLFGSSLELISLVFLALLGTAVYGTIALISRVEAGLSILKVLEQLGAKYLPRSS